MSYLGGIHRRDTEAARQGRKRSVAQNASKVRRA